MYVYSQVYILLDIRNLYYVLSPNKNFLECRYLKYISDNPKEIPAFYEFLLINIHNLCMQISRRCRERNFKSWLT